VTDQLASAEVPQPDRDGAARIWAKTRQNFSESTWSLKRRLAYAFALAGALLTVGCLLGGLALNSMVSAVNLQVDRLDPSARETSYLLASLLNEETGVRGYLLTGRQSFLLPYRDGLTQTAGYIAGLHNLLDPYQRSASGCATSRPAPTCGAPSTPIPPSPRSPAVARSATPARPWARRTSTSCAPPCRRSTGRYSPRARRRSGGCTRPPRP
jgi:hypothetical protein